MFDICWINSISKRHELLFHANSKPVEGVNKGACGMPTAAKENTFNVANCVAFDRDFTLKWVIVYYFISKICNKCLKELQF